MIRCRPWAGALQLHISPGINRFDRSELGAFFLPLLGNSVASRNYLDSPHVNVDKADAHQTRMVLDAESRRGAWSTDDRSDHL